jgi:hypothetical protein
MVDDNGNNRYSEYLFSKNGLVYVACKPKFIGMRDYSIIHNRRGATESSQGFPSLLFAFKVLFD